MKRLLWTSGIIAAVGVFWLVAQPASDPLIQGFRETEVASVSDAMEQLYGQQAFMSHEMRPLEKTKFAGPAWIVLMKRDENKEGGAAVQGMLDAIDAAPAGAVYVMVVENGADYAGIGGLMATGMKFRGLAGAVIDASIRDTPQIRKLQFPVFSRGVVPSTTVNHYRFAGLLVGDPYQLPPIGFGLIFHVLAASPSVPRVELVEIHRQARSSGIPQIAHEVRHGVAPQLPGFSGFACGVNFIDAADGGIMDNLLRVLTAWSGCDDVQTLGVIKRGANGIRAINATMHAYASAGKMKLEGWDLAEGDPIIYLVNDYRRGLWNGSLGRIDRVMSSAGVRVMACSFDGAEHELLEEDFQHVDLAYAITVHKAQASQFKRVIVPITRSRLLDRTLIYTALTRGIEQVVFIGDRHAFDQAIIATPQSQERQVGFSL